MFNFLFNKALDEGVRQGVREGMDRAMRETFPKALNNALQGPLCKALREMYVRGWNECCQHHGLTTPAPRLTWPDEAD